MNPLLGWEIALFLVLVYAVVLIALYRTGRLGPERALSLFGPALMIKTRRGRGWLDRVGRFRRLWTTVADVGIVLSALTMLVVVVVLAFDAVAALRVSAANAPSPAEALGIPGINPLIPVTYGLVALVVGIVLHELFHGIVARSQQIGVKSIGILWFVIPVDALVEQDDQEMQKAPLRKRDRVAAAGVLANFALALLFFAVLATLVSTSVIPNANGSGVAAVVPMSPAANISLQAGDVLVAVNGTATPTNTALLHVLGATRPGESVAVTFYSSGLHTLTTRMATLGANPSNPQRGFLGVTIVFLSPTQLKTIWVAPWSSTDGPLLGATYWLVLPIASLEPVQGPTEKFYHLTGPLAGADPNTFWIVLNLLYYLAWLNLLLGLSNALPIFPLDGGLLFRDFMHSIAQRLRRGWDNARLERFAGQMTAVASGVVLILLL